jgi:hypothetical protein
MECPACNQPVADDAAVCPHCDNVLDPSLLDASPPDDDAPPPPPRRPARPPTRPGAKKVAAKPGAPKKRPATGAKPKRNLPAADDAPPPPSKKQDWRSQISEEDWKENAGRAPEAFVVDRSLDPNDAMAETRRYLAELPLADKLALFGAGTLLFATFLPWKETVEEGDVLGVLSSGVLVTVLAALAVAGIFVRTKKISTTLNPLLPWIAQLGCTGFAGLWCLVYMKVAWDPTLAQSKIGNFEMWVSKPVFGLFLALLAAIVSIVGTIFGLKDVGR